MTVIFVARKSKNKLMMAGDRRLTLDESGHYSTDPNPKIKKIGKTLVGGAGSASGCDLFFTLKSLSHVDKVPAESLNTYLQNTLLKEYRNILVERGFVFKERSDFVETESSHDDGCLFLLVVKGKVFEIYSGNNTVNCLELSAPVGIGCGATTATAIYRTLVALQEDGELNTDPKSKLAYTMSLTATLNSGCDDNIDIISE